MISDCNVKAYADNGNYGRRCQRQPALGQRTLRAEAAHEAARIDHRQAKADQHGRQTGAEGDDKKEAESHAVECECTEQYHQCSRARYNAAGYTQCEQTAK